MVSSTAAVPSSLRLSMYGSPLRPCPLAPLCNAYSPNWLRWRPISAPPPGGAFGRSSSRSSFPGVLAAFFMDSIPTVGEYVTPLLVGGSRGIMFGNIIQDFFTRNANWPRGAALSVMMLAVTLLLVAFARRFVNVKAARMTATQSTISEQGRFSLLTGYFVGLIVLLYLPLAILFLFSLNEGTSLSFPLQGLTLRWYEEVFSSPRTAPQRA